jgi:hypothetical protein
MALSRERKDKHQDIDECALGKYSLTLSLVSLILIGVVFILTNTNFFLAVICALLMIASIIGATITGLIGIIKDKSKGLAITGAIISIFLIIVIIFLLLLLTGGNSVSTSSHVDKCSCMLVWKAHSSAVKDRVSEKYEAWMELCTSGDDLEADIGLYKQAMKEACMRSEISFGDGFNSYLDSVEDEVLTAIENEETLQADIANAKYDDLLSDCSKLVKEWNELVNKYNEKSGEQEYKEKEARCWDELMDGAKSLEEYMAKTNSQVVDIEDKVELLDDCRDWRYEDYKLARLLNGYDDTEEDLKKEVKRMCNALVINNHIDSEKPRVLKSLEQRKMQISFIDECIPVLILQTLLAKEVGWGSIVHEATEESHLKQKAFDACKSADYTNDDYMDSIQRSSIAEKKEAFCKQESSCGILIKAMEDKAKRLAEGQLS